MRKFKFDKLVRDGIADSIIKKGGEVNFKTLDDKEMLIAVKKKLIEEASELQATDDEKLAEELSDIQELINVLCQLKDISVSELENIRAKKVEKAGSFQKRVYIETVEVPDGSEWIDYYLSQQDRYPEIKRKPGVKAFVVYDKKLLLILRDNNPNISFPNTWNLPGGGIDNDESGIEAMRRELKEEISTTPRNLVFLGKQIFEDGSEVFRYLVTLTKEEYENVKLGDEGQKLGFFNIDEVNDMKLAGYLKQYFSRFKNQIKQIVEEGTIPKPELLGLTI